jgi:hypothetical protein
LETSVVTQVAEAEEVKEGAKVNMEKESKPSESKLNFMFLPLG